MSVLSAQTIQELELIQPCVNRTEFYHPDLPTATRTMTYGLGPAGYDLTLDWGDNWSDDNWFLEPGEFRLAAANEYFNLPPHVTGMVYDKSSWARNGLSMFNTVAEPGWCGWLTLELKNMGNERLFLPQGVPIAQVVFTFLDEPTNQPYMGKYQGQLRGPQPAR